VATSIPPTSAAQWLSGSPLDWAQESYQITVSDPVDYCRWETTAAGEQCRSESHRRNLTTQY
jgi:hypothetical protein